MGVLSFCVKFAALNVVFIAVLVALAVNGTLKPLAVYMDSYETSRGLYFRGMVPAMHGDTPWGFSLEEMPDLTGETIFVTGGNVGLGYWTAYHLAANKATVMLLDFTRERSLHIALVFLPLALISIYTNLCPKLCAYNRHMK
jgi:hypothetical protein